jgi:signal transduction histidine kinase
VLDVILAVGFTAAVLAITAAIGNEERAQRPLDWGGVTLIVACGVALVWRRVTPILSLVVTAAAITIYAAFDYQGGPVYLAPLIALFTIASIDGRWKALPYALAVTVISFVVAFTRGVENGALLPHLLYLSWAIGAVLLGDLMLNRRQYLLSLEERARYLEETREEEARRRVAEERLRIARDLHDVVAHSLASINIQSGAGLHVIDKHPEQAREALVAIKAASKEALEEFRSTLEVVRDDGDAPRHPAPGLSDLALLTAGAERGGIQVDLHVSGEQRRLAPAVDVTAYRIIQESLTNVMRHAGAARACVSIRYEAQSIDIEVVDDGRGAASQRNGDGHGIRGMHERAATVGGRVEAGPVAPRGFRVHAHLPVNGSLP